MQSRREDGEHTPYSTTNNHLPQDNDALLSEIRDMILRMKEKVEQHEELNRIRGLGNQDNILENDGLPSDNQSKVGHYMEDQSTGKGSSQQQQLTVSNMSVWRIFRTFNPPTFDGSFKSSVGKAWIDRLETIFTVV
ncbi:uncharacterized protein LOC129318843 [Prosopis cineraria]|uniref:uncharacterized protein LOC129318843 n=1 Tax=Prosopis cineraria TaxID=364024 RepID=UPI00240FAA9D|nr:uncharacterized protein LOC129318843 [Prosopis cineraria]